MFKFDQVAAITDDADAIIRNEREEWEPFYETIENYIAGYADFEGSDKKGSISAGIFVGGSLGVNMLLSKPRTLSDYLYVLYAQDALRHANTLTNLLAAMVAKSYGSVKEILEKAKSVYEDEKPKLRNIPDPKIVMMKTALPYQRYLIYASDRLLVQFNSLPHGSAHIIKPTLAETFSRNNKLFVISPEVQLLDLYRTLYSPARVGEWGEAMRDENNLYQHMKKRLPELAGVKRVDGGGSSDLEAYKLFILSSWIVGNKDVVLIGGHALKLVLKLTSTERVMVQVIAQKSPEEEAAHVCSMLETHFKNAKCTSVTRPLSIMQDFRLQRATVRVNDKEVLYIYNSAGYDFIPFNVALNGEKGSFLQVGNPFVLLRFLLVDFWTVRLLAQEKRIDEKYAKLRLDNITKQVLEMRSKISEVDQKTHIASIGDKFLNHGGLLQVFNQASESYMGVYEDDLQAQKLLLNQGTRRFNDYYPDEAMMRTGAYRVFDDKKDGSYDVPDATD